MHGGLAGLLQSDMMIRNSLKLRIEKICIYPKTECQRKLKNCEIMHYCSIVHRWIIYHFLRETWYLTHLSTFIHHSLTLGSTWCSVSCSRSLQHVVHTPGIVPLTLWLVDTLLQLLKHGSSLSKTGRFPAFLLEYISGSKINSEKEDSDSGKLKLWQLSEISRNLSVG